MAAGATVLVVEDEVLIGEDIREVLLGFGYRVPSVVGSGADAITAADNRTPDLVLMDISLQGPLDGVQTAARLNEKRCLPIVFLTSYSDEQTLARAKTVNPYGYLIKPFTDRELRTSIEVALSKRELETRLAERDRWFYAILSSIADGVIATRDGEIITYINTVAEKLTGWTAAEATGRKLSEVFRASHAAAGTSQAPGETPAPRRELATKGGNRLIIELSISAIVEQGGDRGLGTVVVFRDVTQRAQMEQRLALTQRLASVGTMAAGIAHEINNPLSYIMANVAFALEVLAGVGSNAGAGSGVDATQVSCVREALEDASAGGERVRAIVQQLRRLTRGDTERKVLDLLEVLDVAVKMTANALPRDASLRREYGTAPLVEADEGQLIQVFTNLLVNAYHAVGGERAPAREVRVVTFTGPDGSAVVEIHDTGYGIPRENLGRIFDPFFTTKGAGDGVGLGLSICHSIVRSFAGDITVDSDVGRGSVFRVTLPPTDQPRSQRMPIATPATASRKAHVLVIDDEEGIGKSLRRLLGQSHDVTVERDPRGAIARLGAEKFDVILCDITMPEMSGVDVYEAIKSTDPSAARRMVFMTGGTFSEETQGFLDSVDNIAIAKPFDASDLRRIVNDVSSR